NAAADGSHIGGVQSGIACITAKHAEDTHSLMRSHGGTLAVDRIHGASNRRGKANAVLGVPHVIVHGFWNGNDGHAFLVQPGRVAERVVPTDSDEVVDPQAFQVLQHV